MSVRASVVAVSVSLLSIAVGGVRAEDRTAAVDIGTRREPFVDRFLIDKLTGGAQHQLHRPHDEGAVMTFDRPWEGKFCAYFTVIRATAGRYQMYYRGAGHGDNKLDKDGVTCYAESTDGIHWTRPELDLFPTPDGGKSNVVLAHVGMITHDLSVFVDENPAAKADERYKAIGGYDEIGLFALASGDGVRWRKMSEQPVLTRKQVWPSFAFDSQNVPFWSAAEKKYVLYYRVYKDKKRRIARVESDDFLRWTNPQLMEYRGADGSPAPVEQLYTNQTQPYYRAPHIYVATAARFMQNRQVLTTRQAEAIGVDPKYFHDTSDAILMTSRGGGVYDRTFMTAFIAPGIGHENWVSRTNYPALNVVQTGPTEMSAYANQNYGQPTACLHRYSMRLDGFASVHAEYEPGEMVTRPLTFAGAELLINFATSAAGGVRVEIQNADGTPVPGFAMADCREVIGNEIERRVEWAGGGDLAKLAGKPVRLRFVLRDADLYAIRFADAAAIGRAAESTH